MLNVFYKIVSFAAIYAVPPKYVKYLIGIFEMWKDKALLYVVGDFDEDTKKSTQ